MRWILTGKRYHSFEQRALSMTSNRVVTYWPNRQKTNSTQNDQKHKISGRTISKMFPLPCIWFNENLIEILQSIKTSTRNFKKTLNYFQLDHQKWGANCCKRPKSRGRDIKFVNFQKVSNEPVLEHKEKFNTVFLLAPTLKTTQLQHCCMQHHKRTQFHIVCCKTCFVALGHNFFGKWIWFHFNVIGKCH